MNKKREEIKEKEAELEIYEAEMFVLEDFPHPDEQFTGEHFVEISLEDGSLNDKSD